MIPPWKESPGQRFPDYERFISSAPFLFWAFFGKEKNYVNSISLARLSFFFAFMWGNSTNFISSSWTRKWIRQVLIHNEANEIKTLIKGFCKAYFNAICKTKLWSGENEIWSLASLFQGGFKYSLQFKTTLFPLLYWLQNNQCTNPCKNGGHFFQLSIKLRQFRVIEEKKSISWIK